MLKDTPQTDFLLTKLCELSDQLAENKDNQTIFHNILSIIIDTMGFNVGILYQVVNNIDDFLILKVHTLLDQKGERKDLIAGMKIKINLDTPNPIFVNECNAYKNKSISTINVPGVGSDMMSYINTPHKSDEAYIFGGDFIGDDARLSSSEINACKIINNLLISLFFRKHFESQAIYDGLTKLYNSQKIKSELNIFIKRMDRQKNQALSILLGDVDFFKKINDNYSHIQGDSILEELGNLISCELRTDIDIAGRYGGEEFLLILLNTNSKEAFKSSERIRKKVESFDFKRISENGLEMKGLYLNITMSFGIATLEKGKVLNDSKVLVALADKALYSSKNNGRNCSTALSYKDSIIN